MSERYAATVKELFSGIKAGEHYSRYGRVVEISRGERIKFIGFLVDKSMVIPLSAGKDTEDLLSQYSGANLEVVRANSSESPQEATCHLLGLPYFGHTLGLYSDGQRFGQIDGVHFHPKEYINSQEDFIEFAANALASAGTTLTILE